MTDVPFLEFMGLSDEEYAEFQANARQAGMSEQEFFKAVMDNFKEKNPAPEKGIDIKDYIVPQDVLDDQKRADAVLRKHRDMGDDDSPY